MRIALTDLEDSNEYDLNYEDKIFACYPIYVTNAGTHLLIDVSHISPDILTNITLKARETTASTVNMTSLLMIYQERLT